MRARCLGGKTADQPVSHEGWPAELRRVAVGNTSKRSTLQRLVAFLQQATQCDAWEGARASLSFRFGCAILAATIISRALTWLGRVARRVSLQLPADGANKGQARALFAAAAAAAAADEPAGCTVAADHSRAP